MAEHVITHIDEEKLMSKVRRKVVPYLFILFIICMADRVNISFAALQMNKDLGISASAYGMLAGIFFIAYFFFEVPSNVLMQRFGARIWIARILISWGVVCVLTGFVENITHLAIFRCLLGVAEAGFYPCILLYFTYWFPVRHMARTISMFMCAIVFANILTAPISTMIMDNINWLGMAGWRWMFILEGIPAVIFGILTPFILVDGPEHASYLTREEKDWLSAEIKRESEAKMSNRHVTSKWDGFKNPRVWHLSFCFFCYVTVQYGLSFWIPQIIKELSKVLTNTQIGFISTLPFIVGAIFMVSIARHSDKTGERRYHAAVPLFCTFFCFIALTMTQNLITSVLIICLAAGFIYSFVGSFWSIPNAILSKESAAVGLAIINSIGNLGGFVGPSAVGMIKDATQSTTYSMYFLAILAVIVGIAVLAIPQKDTVVVREH